MTDDTDNIVDIDDTNLEDFEKDFFNTEPKAEAKAEEVSEDEVEDQEDVDEIEDDSLANEDEDADEVEEEDDDEEEIVEVPQLKKRNRAQERIEKLVAEVRQGDRDREYLRSELEKYRAEKEVGEKKEAPTLREQLSADAPSPDAKNEKDEPLYELGEFDPKFIRDLTKFTIAEETKAAKAVAEKEAQEAFVKAAQEEIRDKWMDNLEKAEAEEPEIRENIRILTDTFANLDPVYGEYLASTVMNMDVGPQIMNYLSQNIGEAQKIVASGPHAATLALGRLEARLIKTSTNQEEKRNTKLVSKASEPPEDRARGRGGKFTVAPDTDDLNAFEREFFK